MITKGSDFSLSTSKLETDLTPEMISRYTDNFFSTFSTKYLLLCVNNWIFLKEL